MLNLVLALFIAVPQDGVPTQRPPAPPGTYADNATATLIMRAHGARNRNERLVTSYTATVTQRSGIGLQLAVRDRMLYHQELAAKISWQRDTISTIEWLGARTGVPIAEQGDEVPHYLDSQSRNLVFDPSSNVLLGTGGFDDMRLMHPLSDSGEKYYQYAISQRVTMTLNSTKTLHIVGVTITPRNTAPDLMAGTLWFDEETANLVRAVYRPARPWEMQRDADSATRKDVPGWVDIKYEVKSVSVDYGYYGNHWWMPRFIAVEGVASMGSWLGVPFRAERTYADYEVLGGTPPDTSNKFVPAGRRSANATRAPNDSTRYTKAQRDSLAKLRREVPTNLTVVVPSDSVALLNSPLLGKPILNMGDLVTEEEIRNLAAPLKQLPVRPWEAHVELPRGLSSLMKGARYNRIEALSLGTDAKFDFGKLQFNVEGRLGLGDLVPNGEVTLIKATNTVKYTIAGYRRLAAANPEANPFSIPNSALAFLAQRDDGEYFRTLGAEMNITQAKRGWFNARVYYQQERPAFFETNVALPHLFSKHQLFRPNILADSATEFGGSLTIGSNKQFSHVVNLGFSTTVSASRGDFDYQKASATFRAYLTPKKAFAVALSASAGTSTGTVSTQGSFYLGGPMSLRGHAGGAMRGDAFWLGRIDIGNSFPGARVVAFTDVGWAGPRAGFSNGKPLVGGGIGLGVLDGLLRIDLARAFNGQKGYRLEFYVGGVM